MFHGAVGLALCHAVQQGLALQLADLEVVERDVVVEVRRVLDEPVVGDDLGAGVVGRLLTWVDSCAASVAPMTMTFAPLVTMAEICACWSATVVDAPAYCTST